jgi:hypothetical protein
MFKIILFTVPLLLFAAGSYAQAQFDQSYENLSKEDKKIVDSVRDNFLKNHIILIKELSQANKLIGAAAKSDLEIVTDEKLSDSHYRLGVDTHKNEHLLALISKPEKGADGKYYTPTKVIRNKIYTYKILHTVRIQGKNITFSSSTLSDKKDSRIEIAPNYRVIKSIAKDLKGAVSSSTIKLP